MYKCEKCGKEYKTTQALNSHIGWHNKPGRESNLKEYKRKLINGEVKSSNHYIKARETGIPYIISDETRKKLSVTGKGRKHTQETKDKLSKSMKAAVLKYPDSYSKNNVSGRVKTIEYNGTRVKGTWELAVAEWLDYNDIKWTNELKGIPYEWEGSTHIYFPDFYLFDYDIYIEVKGYKRNRDVAKWNTVDNLIVFEQCEIDLIKAKELNISIFDNIVKPVYEYLTEKPKKVLSDIIKEKHYCIVCGNEIKGKGTKKHKYCSVECYKGDKSKHLPLSEELIIKFNELKTFTSVGLFYGVSGNCVKKWCKKYNILDIVKNIK